MNHGNGVFDLLIHMELLCKDFTVQNGKNIHDIGGKLFTKSISLALYKGTKTIL